MTCTQHPFIRCMEHTSQQQLLHHSGSRAQLWQQACAWIGGSAAGSTVCLSSTDHNTSDKPAGPNPAAGDTNAWRRQRGYRSRAGQVPWYRLGWWGSRGRERAFGARVAAGQESAGATAANCGQRQQQQQRGHRLPAAHPHQRKRVLWQWRHAYVGSVRMLVMTWALGLVPFPISPPSLGL